jgi:hypothetical protein
MVLEAWHGFECPSYAKANCCVNQAGAILACDIVTRRSVLNQSQPHPPQRIDHDGRPLSTPVETLRGLTQVSA